MTDFAKQTSHKMPYPGLRPFRREEADLFFGREEQVDRLLEMLARNRFLAVVGPSGCGKSSLVAAGLIPALKLGLLPTAGENWCIAQMRPGSDPLKNLADALLKQDVLARQRTGEDAAAFLLATLQRGPLGLIEALAETPLPEGHSLLILADQFEEIFRYRRESPECIDQAEAFTDLLLHSAGQENIFVILTMRSDFLGECALFPGLPEAMNQNQFLTPRLTREQRRGAITGPAAMFGKIPEPALVNRLLNDLSADKEHMDQLPVLQHVLMRMWTKGENLDLNAYESIGTMTRALSDHADEAYAELDAELKTVAEVLFKCLCDHAGSGRDTRRPVSLADVAQVTGKSIETLARVVEIFQKDDRSFLSVSADGIVDISHESLIRQWDRLKTWAGEEAVSAAAYQRLEQTAQLWKKGEAGLWGTPDLDMALAWKEKQKPVKQWAARYGNDFELAMEFLERSRLAQEEERRKQEQERMHKLRQKQKQLASALAAFVLAMCLAFWGFYERKQAVIQQKHAEAQKNRAETVEKQRTLGLFESYLTHASLQARIEDYAAARKILNQSRELDKEIPATRRHARNLLAWFTDLMGGTAEKVYQGANVPLINVALSPDGKILAAVGEKGTVVLFDAESGEILKKLEGHENVGDTGSVRAAVFHPNGKWLATAGDDKRILFWSVPDGEILREMQASGQVKTIALSPDNKLLASGGTDNDVTLWNAENGEKIRTMKGHEEMSYALAFHPDGTLLASASYDRTARIWDVKTGKSLHILRGHAGNVNMVAFHPDGNILATCGSDKNIILWESETGRPLAVLQGHENIIHGLAFTESGDRLISGSFDRTLRIWDTETGVTLRLLQGHEAGVTRLAVKGNHIYSAANDMTVRKWENLTPGPFPKGKGSNLPPPAGEDKNVPLPRWEGLGEGDKQQPEKKDGFHPPPAPPSREGSQETPPFPSGKGGRGVRLLDMPSEPSSSAISPDGKMIAAGFKDGGLRLYALPDISMIWEIKEAHSDRTFRLSFSPDGKQIVSASFDNTAKLWQISDGKLLQTFSGHTSAVHGIAFSPNGRHIATASFDGRFGLFEIGKEEGQFHEAHEGKVSSVEFDEKGEKLLTAGADGKTRVWDIRQWPPILLQDFPKSADAVMWAAISPDRTNVASVGRGGIKCRVFSTKDGTETQRLIGHENNVFRAAFSPDSGQLATISADATVRFWDLETGECLFTLQLPSHSGNDPVPLWDFTFRCTPTGWLAIPLTRGKLAVYEMGGIYD